jgi:hypothetical protein
MFNFIETCYFFLVIGPYAKSTFKMYKTKLKCKKFNYGKHFLTPKKVLFNFPSQYYFPIEKNKL